MIGEGIRLARRSKKIKQKDLAAAMGISVNALIEIEKDRTNIRRSNLLNALKMLGISEDEMLFYSIKDKTTVLNNYISSLIEKQK